MLPRSLVVRKPRKALKRPTINAAPVIVDYRLARKPAHCAAAAHPGQNDVELSDGSDSSEEVVQFRRKQRFPQVGEPVCVVCGRYGAYICDATEADVCSLECKGVHLEGGKRELQPVVRQAPFVAPYTTPVAIERLSKEQVASFLVETGIEMQGVRAPRPILEFNQCGLPPRIVENLLEHGYATPTPVQMAAMPTILLGRNMLVRAQTGSGKSASFLLPTIHHVLRTGALSLKALILVPTRELGLQVHKQLAEAVAGVPGLATVACFGGLSVSPQLHRIRKGAQAAVGTPGRVLDIVRKHEDIAHIVSSITLLIVDEVDVMLKMGFAQQTAAIVALLPSHRQMGLFSATMPPAVKTFAGKHLQDPITISVGDPGPSANVQHTVRWVPEHAKKAVLGDLIADPAWFRPPIVVFVAVRSGADLLAEALQTKGVSAVSLHGDKSPQVRKQAMDSFLAGTVDVLVSTPVAGRGIDMPSVRVMVNFDLPDNVDEFVHQIGRVGRLGQLGWAVSFVNERDKKVLPRLATLLRDRGVRLPPEVARWAVPTVEHGTRPNARSKRKASTFVGPHPKRRRG